MSYVVLARRYRPRRFCDLVGQEVVARTLKNALAGARGAHAYLLTGIRGVGKTTIARIMAMRINCTDPQEGEPCGQCEHCASIGDGSAMDVIEMDAASHSRVEEMRDLIAGVRYPPTSMPTKVYIIDEAHMLSNSAFNALLKTLEEPPGHAVFILATTEADKLPVTVRSRCQRFDLGRLSVQQIQAHLKRVLREEGIAAEDAALAELARASEGSVRDALSLTERAIALEPDSITLSGVRQSLGLIGEGHARRLADPVLAGDAEAAVTELRALVMQGASPRRLLEALAELLHQISCVQVAPDLLEREYDADFRGWLEDQAGRWSSMAIDTRYQVAMHGLQSLEWIDERLGVEMVLMRLARLCMIQPAERPMPQGSEEDSGVREPAPPISKEGAGSPVVSGAGEAAEDGCPEQGAAVDNATPIAAAPEHLQELGGGVQSWEEALAKYQQDRPALAAVFEHVRCRSFDAHRVELLLSDNQQKTIGVEERRHFQQWLGREVQWLSAQEQDVAIETVSSARRRQAEQERVRLRQQAERDPHIRRLQSALDCTLLEVLPPGALGGAEAAVNA